MTVSLINFSWPFFYLILNPLLFFAVVRGVAQLLRNIKNHFRRKKTIRLISHRVNKLRENPKICDSSLMKRILRKEIALLNPDNANRVSADFLGFVESLYPLTLFTSRHA